MIKYLLLGVGILYASKAYAKRLAKVRETSLAKNKIKQASLDSISE